MAPGYRQKEIGIREGEKLHEVMVTQEDSAMTYEYEKHYIIYPHYNWWEEGRVLPGGAKVREGFEYSSGTNKEWLDVEQLRELLARMGR